MCPRAFSRFPWLCSVHRLVLPLWPSSHFPPYTGFTRLIGIDDTDSVVGVQTILASGLREGQRAVPVLGDRLAQSLGIDGRGIDKTLQSDPAELREDGNRDVLGSDVWPDGAVGDSGSDVLAQVGAERLVPFAEDPGQLCRRGRLGPQQQ